MSRLRTEFPLVNGHPDVAGVLRDPDLLRLVSTELTDPFRDQGVTVVMAPEARGPILGAMVAIELGAGLVLARKNERNHPGADIPVTSSPTWRGTREVFLGRSFDLTPSDRVLVVDDWITTGSTLRAVGNIVRLLGAAYVGASVLVNKAPPQTIKELQAHTVVDFDDLMTNERRN